jgi:hypothetical protein
VLGYLTIVPDTLSVAVRVHRQAARHAHPRI